MFNANMFELDMMAHNTAAYFKRQAHLIGDKDMVTYWENLRKLYEDRVRSYGLNALVDYNMKGRKYG